MWVFFGVLSIFCITSFCDCTPTQLQETTDEIKWILIKVTQVRKNDQWKNVSVYFSSGASTVPVFIPVQQFITGGKSFFFLNPLVTRALSTRARLSS